MESKKQSRKEFMTTTAAAGAAAVLATAGFNRIANAQDSEMISQLAIFGYNADKKDEAAEALAKLAKNVEDNEPDVLAYIPHLNEKDGEVVFFEVYKDAAAVANHGQQPYMADLRPLFASVFKPPLKIVKLDRVGGYWR